MKISTFAKWLMENWLISSGESVGQKYSFKRHGYLWGIANDEHDHIVIQKSAQCGISELEVAHMVWLVDDRLGNALYIFPASEQMRDFVDGRVKTAVYGNPYLESRCTGNFSSKQIHWGKEGSSERRIIYFRGSTTMSQIISVDASRLKVDEVDQCDPVNLAALEKRLGAASRPIQHWFSTPQFPEQGINAMYLESDQKKWHIKCEHCNEWQWLDWEESVRFDYTPAAEDPIELITNVKVICRKCGKELDRLSSGEWVAAFPKREIHGYHISKLFSPFANMRKLCINSTKVDYGSALNFWNQDLGLPYMQTEAKLTRKHLDECVLHYPMQQSWSESSFMGVDVGLALHVVIGSEVTVKLPDESEEKCHGLVWIGTVPDFNELDQLMLRYNVESCVIDAQPETRKAREFVDKHRRKARMCYYDSTKGSKDLWQPGRDGRTITAQRTLAMSHVYAQFARSRIALPRDAARVSEFYDQMQSPQLVYIEDKNTGEKRAAYPKTMKPDHYYHACVYEMLARRQLPVTVRVHQREWY